MLIRHATAVSIGAMGDAFDVVHDMAVECRTHGADAAVATLAGRQHGVVARTQLLRLGLGRGAIAHRIERGRLHPVHRGVYAVGHRVVSREGVWMAAVLVAEPVAALSHRAAAALWAMRAWPGGTVDITLGRAPRGRPGLRMHRAALAPDELTTHRGIPVTTPARTLLDLAAVVGASELARAAHEAEARRLGSPTSLAELADRYPRRPGVPAIRRLLDEQVLGDTITRSELEDRFLALLDAARLPRPRANASVELRAQPAIEVDFVWPRHRLVVEVDGFATHATRRGFERDRARDRALQAAGWRVVRLTWRQLHASPDEIAADVRALLEYPPAAA